MRPFCIIPAFYKSRQNQKSEAGSVKINFENDLELNISRTAVVKSEILFNKLNGETMAYL